jgi:hypothetical protein
MNGAISSAYNQLIICLSIKGKQKKREKKELSNFLITRTSRCGAAIWPI